MATYNNVSDGRPDGSMVGNDATDKVGFWGVAPTTQPTNAAQAALTLTSTISGGFGFGTSAAMNAMLAQLENIRASLVLMGLLKGS